MSYLYILFVYSAKLIKYQRFISFIRKQFNGYTVMLSKLKLYFGDITGLKVILSNFEFLVLLQEEMKPKWC